MASRRKLNQKGRNEGPVDPFTRLPHTVQSSPAWSATSPNGRVLLLEMLSMHNGSNNGSLWLSVRDAAYRMGLANTDSAMTAFAELETVGFIRMTKDAHFSVKASDTSRARCWRVTFLHAPGAGVTDEWRKFEPPTKAVARRMQRGLTVRNAYYKAKAQEKLPVPDSGTVKPDKGAKQPKSVVPDSGTYIAMTMGSGGNALCWRDRKGLHILPDVAKVSWPDRSANQALAA